MDDPYGDFGYTFAGPGTLPVSNLVMSYNNIFRFPTAILYHLAMDQRWKS